MEVRRFRDFACGTVGEQTIHQFGRDVGQVGEAAAAERTFLSRESDSQYDRRGQRHERAPQQRGTSRCTRGRRQPHQAGAVDHHGGNR